MTKTATETAPATPNSREHTDGNTKHDTKHTQNGAYFLIFLASAIFRGAIRDTVVAGFGGAGLVGIACLGGSNLAGTDCVKLQAWKQSAIVLVYWHWMFWQ